MFFTGCHRQPAVSQAESETRSESVLQASAPESDRKKVVLYSYQGLAPSPTDHKLTRQAPQDAREIQETVTIPSDGATPDGIMKLYTEKYLSEPVANGSMVFSYAGAVMDKNGVVTVDFTKAGARYLSYGSMLEMNSLYGIAKTMLMNVEGSTAVCYGIDGGDYSTESFLDRDTPYLTR
ncbi:hypothetical protein [Caproiciproducens sp.]|uniref:hypothetical protein n=1 Tax=Caproiciproducens sp. TaxID=1954376 RepID=UPI00289F979E|nr:hypothetical protein [Caproiciproducens sp.]